MPSLAKLLVASRLTERGKEGEELVYDGRLRNDYIPM